MNDVMAYLGPVLSMFGAGGAAWAALKVGLNGTQARVKRIEDTTDRIESAVRKAENKLSVLESRHDTLAEIVKDHPGACPWQPRSPSERTRRNDNA